MITDALDPSALFCQLQTRLWYPTDRATELCPLAIKVLQTLAICQIHEVVMSMLDLLLSPFDIPVVLVIIVL